MDTDSLLKTYKNYCAAQQPNNIDADGASFYRFVHHTMSAINEVRLLSVCAVEYLLAALSAVCSRENLGCQELGFGCGTECSDGFLFVLGTNDFQSFTTADTPWLPETGVFLAPTGQSGEFLWASIPPFLIACSDVIVCKAPNGFREVIGHLSGANLSLQGELGIDDILTSISSGSPGCCNSRPISP
ncbi:MAG: hypothetical protein ACXW1E_04695 [Halobacteriota archaeon]